MKFSLKVFFAATIVLAISFSIGGYLLMTSLFQTSLQGERESAINENILLRFSFEAALSAVQEEVTKANVGELADSLVRRTTGRDTVVRVYSDRRELLYATQNSLVDASFLRTMNADTRISRIQNTGDRYYIQTICSASVGTQEETLYLESIRDITSLFSERDAQFETLRNIMILLILINSVVLFFITRVLTNPIRKLSRAARRITGGEMGHRAEVHSHDEIGMLAADFNAMADELELRIQELEEDKRRREDFVASFAHELKTPLTSMIGYADMLRSRELEPEERFMAAGYIFSEGKRLEALSLKLLDLIVLRKRDFALRAVNMPHLFEAVGAFMRPVVEGGQITFTGSAENATVQVEPDLFKTLLINLLDNARKAIDGRGSILLCGKVEEGGYGIYVRDTGKGIAPEDLPLITEAFYMADKSRSRKKGGAGLGLAICAEIAQLHGGTIDFQSVPQKGTIVHVFIPVGGEAGEKIQDE